MDNIIYMLAVSAVPMLLAITLHEAAHGYAAAALGDPTPARFGRRSWNPFNHFDWIGTALLPALSIAAVSAAGGASALIIGWAKPTPMDVSNFAQPRRDIALVVMAGVAANIVMGVLWALAFRLVDVDSFRQVAIAGMLWNVGIAVFHLIPIPPTAAGLAIASVLPPTAAARYFSIMPYATFIFLGLAISGVLGAVVGPINRFGMGLLALLATA